MSHFTVAVFTKPNGKTVDELLAKYDENLELPRYVSETKEDIIKRAKKEIQDYATNGYYAEYLRNPDEYIKGCSNNKAHLNYIQNEFPKKLTWTDEEIYQHEIRYYEEDQIGENGEIYSTYNPNSKWDWYSIGGRWSGRLLKLKNGEVGLMGEEGAFGFNGKDGYVDSALVKNIDFDKDFCTYAVVLPDGSWLSSGTMGWFGCSSETEDEYKAWQDNYYDNFIKNANPDWQITIVDCHI